MPRGGFHPVELRVQVLTLSAIGFSTEKISKSLNLSPRTVQSIVKKGRDRGYRPEVSLRVQLEFVEDRKRSGRPVEITEATQNTVITSVTADRAGREKLSEILAYEAGISHSSVLCILHSHGFVIAKPSWKPGLTEAACLRRLEFCLAHQHWTLEDWKRVIFTDETGVILGHRRGAIRVWRTVKDSHTRNCVRRRWKACSDFMVWGCFSYNKKGPLHIYKPETAAMRKQADIEIEAMNRELEPLCREEWELATGLSRVHLRPNRGRVPKWNWNEKNEDSAPAHCHRIQQHVYKAEDVQKILDWPGNSPDLNAIEPCWAWMKKRTTSRGAPRDKKTGEAEWRQAWADLPQETIQHWIERLICHIQIVIELEGGNEYKEGREDRDTRSWAGRRIKG
ncbi:hypothetical protein AN9381.2 [Aspergillus nidulans FGSC A4]|uniref:Tc1-like transposase DDE domain-containing protein n=1 Tax=Emericella nidulans (strain FGSC A4 / ATCC 38163 / CBS 112.46 / NRRL 194 / M139) TaxID=227321 RepID=Q5BFJ7_EMENI|nr:hypothetical protein [Aspergillus nidulans FGSC A4]XP_682650.1 hypothetical protein [Aspergillus nidulans FGSC A4]EAA65459.1 hypothetical protein AN0683.2 [Aspergillus nidulans FGSC A4]EAA66448.1 hypothetical protein AN9381.2 [Aspergillus nidulans FGSC A4]CBF87508.1 TPA: conserved hypothetical protein [Aspergillus nidulans FGSC A4]CBF88991.1 TPA: conserved hypothetical protein [Aspergillus nidulans FGSC A4]|eukprot:XP_658287.1 hypothetical protein AN0683.2 [Aspergillus nidulans FGSC A4]